MTVKDHQAQVTFEALGVHQSLCHALTERHIVNPNELQKKTLQHTVRDFADIIVEAPLPRSGRHTLISVLAAHCCLFVGAIPLTVHNNGGGAKNATTVGSNSNPQQGRNNNSSNNNNNENTAAGAEDAASPAATATAGAAAATTVPPVVIVVCKSTQTMAKLHHTLTLITGNTGVVAVQCHDDHPPSHPQQATAKGLVYLGLLPTLSKWNPDLFSHTVTLIVEDCSAHESETLKQLIELLIQVSTSSNLCLLSTSPPSSITPAIRYLLRRKNRRYYYHQPSPPKFSYLMCHDAEDRSALSLKLSTLQGFKSILVLTHNRDVRDLKALLHAELGVKTFSIQRNTSNADHDRILNDFLRSPYAILVAMDAYTGVDLMDVDAVIQYYPPQKSMPEEEWAEFVSYLQSTNDPISPTIVTTIVAPDDFALISYFMKRVGHEGPVINVSPLHPQFQATVLTPHVVAAEKQLLDKSGSAPTAATSGNSPTTPVTPTTGSGNHHGPQQQQGGGGGAHHPNNVPLPRSRRDGDGPSSVPPPPPTSNNNASHSNGQQQHGGGGSGKSGNNNNNNNNQNSGKNNNNNNNNGGGGNGGGGGGGKQNGKQNGGGGGGGGGKRK